MNKVKTKYQCSKCGYYFSAKAGNYKKHILSCDGNYVPNKKRNDCVHCGLDFENLNSSERANHTRWCVENPKRGLSKDGSKPDYSQLRTDEAREKASIKIKESWENGSYDNVDFSKNFLGKSHTEESKQLIREKALASPHRRLKKGLVEYKGILLDSSWELELAKRLDELNVNWVRPDPIPWTDEDGVTHNYFPDFYLEDYDLFLDPKNPHAVKVQKKKLDRLLVQYNNIVIIKSIEECKNFIPGGSNES